MILGFLEETWWPTSEMAPYPMLGIVIAGLLRVFFNEEWVRTPGSNWALPDFQGGGHWNPATVATPQTGVDAILLFPQVKHLKPAGRD